jgi:hypothetical protein
MKSAIFGNPFSPPDFRGANSALQDDKLWGSNSTLTFQKRFCVFGQVRFGNFGNFVARTQVNDMTFLGRGLWLTRRGHPNGAKAAI